MRRAISAWVRESSSVLTSPLPVAGAAPAPLGAGAGAAAPPSVGLDDPAARAAALQLPEVHSLIAGHAAGDGRGLYAPVRLIRRGGGRRRGGRFGRVGRGLLGGCRGGRGFLAGGVSALSSQPRDDLADRQRVALGSHDGEDAVGVGLVGHVRLVGLDLDELVAASDLVAVGLEPLDDRPLLHGVRQPRHHHLAHRATSSASRASRSASVK